MMKFANAFETESFVIKEDLHMHNELTVEKNSNFKCGKKAKLNIFSSLQVPCCPPLEKISKNIDFSLFEANSVTVLCLAKMDFFPRFS